MSTAKIVRCGSLVDGTGSQPIPDAAIIIEHDRIVSVVAADELDAGRYGDAEVIDASAFTVVPGLIDAHAHICMDGDIDPAKTWELSPMTIAFRAARNMIQAYSGGVLTMRDAAAPYGISLAAKKAVAEGVAQGPRLVICGAALCITGGHGHHLSHEVDGPEECRKAAREQIKQGADFIKLMATGGVATAGEALGAPQLTVEEMTAAVDAAHLAGKHVAAHAIGDVGIRNALSAGVDTIEHGVAFDDDTIELMLQSDCYLVPTFSPAFIQATRGKEMGMPTYVVEKARQAWDTHASCIRQAAKAGVPIALGTDVGGPGVRHGNIVLELELMLSTGVCATEMDCLVSATRRSAEAIGVIDDVGTIEPGKQADLVAVDGNPLQDLSALRSIRLIVQSGQSFAVGHRATARTA